MLGAHEKKAGDLAESGLLEALRLSGTVLLRWSQSARS
ncbi:MAG: hypothetical protein RJA34_382, partial [Pseudomonadota bacterium]